ncbi:YcxB family protein [Sulfidibacter corallicola]|uniref:YcxB family protein n=1 Tax=Sulfidibacter corallicola TaxID=2818388 RepID=A0A8A4TR00_SULCO|nr:YcxB family protein [Sulfidibacter corallicola]QTD51438.1 YcxB family protein [Sulfidibacter corallicola]
MEVRFTYEDGDILRGLKLMHQSLGVIKRISLLMLGIVVVFGLLLYLQFPDVKRFLIFYVPVLLFGGLFLWLLKFSQLKAGQAMMKQMPFYTGETAFLFGDEGVRVTGQGGDLELKWGFFLGFSEGPETLLLWPGYSQAYMVPLAYCAPGERELLLSLVKNHLEPYNPQPIAIHPKGNPKTLNRVIVVLMVLVVVLFALLQVLRHRAHPYEEDHPHLYRSGIAPLPWLPDFRGKVENGASLELADAWIEYAVFQHVYRSIYPEAWDDGHGYDRLAAMAEGFRIFYWTQIIEAEMASSGYYGPWGRYGEETLRQVVAHYRKLGLPEVAEALETDIGAELSETSGLKFLAVMDRASAARIRFFREHPELFPFDRPVPIDPEPHH